jgi:hypothetical protein
MGVSKLPARGTKLCQPSEITILFNSMTGRINLNFVIWRPHHGQVGVSGSTNTGSPQLNSMCAMLRGSSFVPRVAASLFAKTSWPSAAMKKLGVSAKWSRQANGPRRVTSSATFAANARTLFVVATDWSVVRGRVVARVQPETRIGLRMIM